MSGEFLETTDEASEKLANLQQLFPEDTLNPQIVEFGNLLSDSLNPQLIPIGFVMASVILIADLERGVDGYTDKPIDSTLAKQPPKAYESLLRVVPTLAEVTFSEPFALEVRKLVEDFLTKDGKDSSVLPKLGTAPAEVLSRPLPGMPPTYEELSSAVDPVEDAEDGYEAMGRWWAFKVLNPEFDNGGTDETNLRGKSLVTTMARERRPLVEEKARQFATAVADLLREQGRDSIYVDYNADPLLMEAASRVEMEANNMTTFPWKSSTRMQDGVVLAKSGYRAESVQIWPPLDR